MRRIRAELLLDGPNVTLPLTFRVHLDRVDASLGVPPGVDDWEALLPLGTGHGLLDASRWLDRHLTDADRARLVAWLYEQACAATED